MVGVSSLKCGRGGSNVCFYWFSRNFEGCLVNDSFSEAFSIHWTGRLTDTPFCLGGGLLFSSKFLIIFLLCPEMICPILGVQEKLILVLFLGHVLQAGTCFCKLGYVSAG